MARITKWGAFEWVPSEIFDYIADYIGDDYATLLAYYRSLPYRIEDGQSAVVHNALRTKLKLRLGSVLCDPSALVDRAIIGGVPVLLPDTEKLCMALGQCGRPSIFRRLTKVGGGIAYIEVVDTFLAHLSRSNPQFICWFIEQLVRQTNENTFIVDAALHILKIQQKEANMSSIRVIMGVNYICKVSGKINIVLLRRIFSSLMNRLSDDCQYRTLLYIHEITGSEIYNPQTDICMDNRTTAADYSRSDRNRLFLRSLRGCTYRRFVKIHSSEDMKARISRPDGVIPILNLVRQHLDFISRRSLVEACYNIRVDKRSERHVIIEDIRRLYRNNHYRQAWWALMVLLEKDNMPESLIREVCSGFRGVITASRKISPENYKGYPFGMQFFYNTYRYVDELRKNIQMYSNKPTVAQLEVQTVEFLSSDKIVDFYHGCFPIHHPKIVEHDYYHEQTLDHEQLSFLNEQLNAANQEKQRFLLLPLTMTNVFSLTDLNDTLLRYMVTFRDRELRKYLYGYQHIVDMQMLRLPQNYVHLIYTHERHRQKYPSRVLMSVARTVSMIRRYYPGMININIAPFIIGGIASTIEKHRYVTDTELHVGGDRIYDPIPKHCKLYAQNLKDLQETLALYPELLVDDMYRYVYEMCFTDYMDIGDGAYIMDWMNIRNPTDSIIFSTILNFLRDGMPEFSFRDFCQYLFAQSPCAKTIQDIDELPRPNRRFLLYLRYHYRTHADDRVYYYLREICSPQVCQTVYDNTG